jgi:hypothetical protein
MDANTARTLNMRRLVAAANGPAEWTRQYGGTRWVQAQVSQWISETNPKGIGGRLARDLERAMGLDHGDLDRPPAEASQVAGQTRDIVRIGVRVVAIIKEGGFREVTDENYADVLYDAMKAVQELGISDGASELDMVRLARAAAGKSG